jgi:hypothetical protein
MTTQVVEMLGSTEQELEGMYSNGIYSQIPPGGTRSHFKVTVSPGKISLPFI